MSDLENEHRQSEILQKGWENGNKIIENENNYINHRLTSFLTLQGFLFTALTFGTTKLVEAPVAFYRWLLCLILMVLAGLGYYSAFLVNPVLRAAFRHIHATREWWIKFESDPVYRQSHPFPVPIGKTAWSCNPLWPFKVLDEDEPYSEMNLEKQGDERINEIYKMGLAKLSNVLAAVWVAFLVIFATILLREVLVPHVSGRDMAPTISGKSH